MLSFYITIILAGSALYCNDLFSASAWLAFTSIILSGLNLSNLDESSSKSFIFSSLASVRSESYSNCSSESGVFKFPLYLPLTRPKVSLTYEVNQRRTQFCAGELSSSHLVSSIGISDGYFTTSGFFAKQSSLSSVS